ncbi:MAG: hypothetical protein QOK48_3090 [Blastocatellia bacterium]|jgi:uncharacterized protein YdhG (YjbR/CyaY superfamily)|nr:hypothetical protein [Blastocatellia bacterium]
MPAIKTTSRELRAGVVDKYLASVPEKKRATLEKLRRTIRTVVPEAEEIIWYQIPTFKFQGKPLVSFAAFKNHCSLFPMSMAIIRAHQDELKGYLTSKGTVRFTSENPLPATLVKKIVRARVKENQVRAQQKSSAAKT